MWIECATQVKPGNVMLGKGSQTEEATECLIPFT